MIFNVRALAEEKSNKTGIAVLDWSKVLENAQVSLKFGEGDAAGLIRLVQASSTPQKLALVVRLIYQYGKQSPTGPSIITILFEKVDRSQFSLADWVDSIVYFQEWLQQNSRIAEFESMLEYLECCAAAPDAKEASPTLFALAQEMLDVHGYEGR